MNKEKQKELVVTSYELYKHMEQWIIKYLNDNNLNELEFIKKDFLNELEDYLISKIKN